jgi:hypothetical protein
MAQTLAPQVREMDRRMQRMVDRLNEIGTLDFRSGTVNLTDEGRLREIAVEALGDEDGVAYAKALVDLAHGGIAVLVNPDDRGEGGMAIPWHLLTSPLVPKDVLQPGMLGEFGIGPVPTPALTRQRLKDRFPNVPSRMLEESNLERLNEMSFLGANSFIGSFFDTLWDIVIRGVEVKPAEPVPETPAPNAVDRVIECFKTSQWNVHWWGFEICLDHDCAENLANVILSGLGARLVDALKALVSGVLGGGVAVSGIAATAIKVLGGAAAAALAAIGLYTALSIQANNTPRGVCLQCPWPVFGGFVWWARGR